MSNADSIRFDSIEPPQSAVPQPRGAAQAVKIAEGLKLEYLPTDLRKGDGAQIVRTPPPVPAQMWVGASPVAVQMWPGGEPSPGADVARGSPCL